MRPVPEQLDILLCGVTQVISREELQRKLEKGKSLRIKLGIDPTSPDIHLGHTVALSKLRQFQDLGHIAVMIIGDFTAMIGDPTGRSTTRPPLTREEILANAKTYQEQAFKILDHERIEIVFNGNWFSKMTFTEVIKLSSSVSISQMLQRRDFRERLQSGSDIRHHETFYPIMQGWDSVMIQADVELGGTDQTFNLLAGRVLQKGYGQVPQDIMTVPLLEGTDGKLKMGKTTGNYIGVNEKPAQMFGKVMSIPDEMILKYFELATSVTGSKIEEVKKALTTGQNPRDLKMELASQIVTEYHDAKAAQAAQEEFINVFSNKELPDNIELKLLPHDKISILELLAVTGLAPSKSEARRLITQGGVKIGNNRIESIDHQIDLKKEQTIQVGKRKFLKVKKG